MSSAACPARPVVGRVTERPVVASTAVRDALSVAPAAASSPGRVLAAFPAALYVAVASDVLAVVTLDGLRLPNAAVLPQPTARLPFARHRQGAPVEVRDGALRVGSDVGGRVDYRPVRWWSPRAALPGPAATVLPSVVDELARRLESGPVHGARVAGLLAAGTARLQAALLTLDLPQARAAADELLGLGPGLTPAGDDVLAGVLVTCGQLHDCPGAAPVAALARALGEHVAQRAPTRTPALSAALLRHAARGLAAAPVLAVVDALVGRRPLGPALTELLAVGHTSGQDTARGVLAAAVALRTAAGAPVPATPSASLWAASPAATVTRHSEAR